MPNHELVIGHDTAAQAKPFRVEPPTPELKILAESLARDIEQAEHKPGQWAETAQSLGGICCHGEKFQIGKPWPKEEPWAQFSYKRDSWLAVAAVNALPRLLTLIAENARLTEQVSTLQTDANSWQSGYDEGRRMATKTALAERDQLKAENERLAAACEKAEQIINAESKAAAIATGRGNLLQAENEALHKALSECADSLHGEMLQKFGGQLPEDMHPVTRRDYDRDMAEIAGYRAALSKGEQP